MLERGYALECWKCSSDIDRNCRDPFNVSDSAGRGGRYYDNRYNDRQTYDPNNPNYNSNNPNYNPNNPNYNPNYNPNFPSYNSFSGQTPALERCDDNEASLKRMKNVCIKKTIRGR
ncbi:hypothetical protein NQ318_022422 [Aromia moschata]|uniref:Uncharacterized protein n=1 Tax=Aromia moschata TaxID=1265417 RepID=A0AAV8Z7H8_9CUCU|nr:hypothetical protein NQ318_022422 [Aromia moschata]